MASNLYVAVTELKKQLQREKEKTEKLKSLLLLTDSSVANVEMNPLTTKQWLEFIKEFPEEAE